MMNRYQEELPVIPCLLLRIGTVLRETSQGYRYCSFGEYYEWR